MIILNVSGELFQILCSGAAGSFGGFVAGIGVPKHNTLQIMSKRIKLGALGDIFIGFAAGIVILILQDGHASGEQLTINPNPFSPHLWAMGILAGVAGNRLLQGMSKAMLGRMMAEQEKLGNKVDQMDKIVEYIREGEKLLEQKEPAAAEKLFQKVLEIEPRHHLAHLDLGKSYRHQADKATNGIKKELMDKAISELTTAIEVSPRYDRAYYNRACYRAITGASVDSVIADLKTSIELFPPNKDFAKSDNDFNEVKSNPLFRNLIEV